MLSMRSVAARISPFAARRAAMPLRMTGLRFYSNQLSDSSPAASYGPDPTVRYSENHEWVAVHKDQTAFIGITKYAADALGETTFAGVLEDGSELERGDTVGEVESVKSASEVYTPISGTFEEANAELAENVSWVNEDPMGKAWFAKIKAKDASELEELMDYEQYEAFLKEI